MSEQPTALATCWKCGEQVCETDTPYCSSCGAPDRDPDECPNGGGPHMWTDTGTNLVCECCGEERP